MAPVSKRLHLKGLWRYRPLALKVNLFNNIDFLLPSLTARAGESLCETGWGGAGKVAGSSGPAPCPPRIQRPCTQGQSAPAHPGQDHSLHRPFPCLHHGAKRTLSLGRGQKAANSPQTPAGSLAAGGPAETALGSPRRLRGLHTSPAPWGRGEGPGCSGGGLALLPECPGSGPRSCDQPQLGSVEQRPPREPREQRWDVTRAPPGAGLCRARRTSDLVPKPASWAPAGGRLCTSTAPQVPRLPPPKAHELAPGGGKMDKGQERPETPGRRESTPEREHGGQWAGRVGSEQGRSGSPRSRAWLSGPEEPGAAWAPAASAEGRATWRSGPGPAALCPALGTPSSHLLTSAVGGSARRGASGGAGAAAPHVPRGPHVRAPCTGIYPAFQGPLG